jgi:hypothetical protein
MRRVYEQPAQAARLAARGAEDVARMLSPQATGAAMRRRLVELAGGEGANGMRSGGQ